MATTTNIISKLVKSSDGTPIYAEAHGNPAHPAVVFAPGFAFSGIAFDRLFKDKRMLERLYLVRYDPRGHGQSGKPVGAESYRSELYAADFAAVAEAFQLGGRAPVFVGWSAGTETVSDICTHLSPVPISGFIAIGGAPIDSGMAMMRPALLGVLPRMLSSETGEALAARAEIVDAMFDDAAQVPFADKAAWMGCMTVHTPAVTNAITRRHQVDASRLKELGKKGFPVMMVYGTEERMLDTKKGAEAAREAFIAFEDRPVEGSRSHAVFYDHVEETVDRILPFCLRVSGKTFVD